MSKKAISDKVKDLIIAEHIKNEIPDYKIAVMFGVCSSTVQTITTKYWAEKMKNKSEIKDNK